MVEVLPAASATVFSPKSVETPPFTLTALNLTTSTALEPFGAQKDISTLLFVATLGRSRLKLLEITPYEVEVVE